MNEHILFQDIPLGSKNGKFHSAVLTTYAIDLIHFDCHLRNTLHRKQITSINILADSSQVDKAVEFTDPQYLTHIGKEYSVSSMKANGAFHPKINFFVGYNAVLVLIGSGNLTVTGHGKNHETFTGFMIDDDNDLHRPLIEECWQYLLSFKDQFGDFERRRILNEIPDNCNILDNNRLQERHKLHKVADNLQAALLYHEKGKSILSQLADIIPLNEVMKISVLSPYFDHDGATLRNLLELCSNAKMNVLIQKDCSLPPYNMEEDSRVTFFDFDETKRGKTEQNKFKDFARLAHAKLYLFETESTKYCIVGSANATKSGLGTMGRRGANEEFCVLYASDKIDFLGELGLKVAKKHKLTMKELNQSLPIDEKHSTSRILKLHSVCYDSGELRIYYEGLLPDFSTVNIYNGEDIVSSNAFNAKDGIISVKAQLKKQSCICYINDIDRNCISNKVFINRIEELDSTNPSPAVRELNRVVYQIESEGFDGLEIVGMLSDLMFQFVEESASFSIAKKQSSSSIRSTDKKLPDIKYNPSLDNDEVASVHAVGRGRASRLIECIEESIKKKLQSMEDDIKDEEELATSESSNQRTAIPEQSVHLAKSDIHYCEEQACNLLNKFWTLVDKRTRYCQEKHQTVSMDDLCYFSLVMFASTEICYLNRFLYEFNCSSSREESHYKKKLYDGLDSVMEHEGLDCFVAFSKFCSKYYQDKTSDGSFKRTAHRAIKYGLLYTMFFLRFAINQKFNERKVVEAMTSLINLFGMSDREYLEKEYQPLIEKYNHVFEFRYIERTLRQLGFSI